MIVLGARRLDRIRTLSQELAARGTQVLAVQTDVTSYEQTCCLVKAAIKRFGRIDVMLNNAGVAPLSPLERLKVEEWNETIDVNIKGVLHGIATVLPPMIAQKSGQIINVSSVAADSVTPTAVVYAASKMAVRTITEGLRKEVKPYNIRTTVISPGAVSSELTASTKEPDIAGLLMQHAVMALPADSFARVVGFAISQPQEVDVNEVVFRPTRQQ